MGLLLIDLYTQAGGATKQPLTGAEFKTLVCGDEPFTMINMTQDGIGSVISTMYVSIYPLLPSDQQEYMIAISGGGIFVKRRVVREDIYKTLLNGYGLWSLP